MKRSVLVLVAAVLLLATGGMPHAGAEEVSLPAAEAPGDLSGVRDFDFLMGDWRVHHRIKRPVKDGQWAEFEGDCSERPLMGGRGNVEEHRFDRATGVTYGVAIRSYDPKTAEWAIWWIDSRLPHGAMDPPMKGRFRDGVGTFYSDSTLDGKPIKVRFLWIPGEADAPRWEQAYSEDGGATWTTNWTMAFRRAAPAG
jgi:hypothetical protein